MYTISQKRKSGWEAAAGVVNKVSLEHPQGLRCLLLSSSGGSLLPLMIPTWLPQIQLPHAGKRHPEAQKGSFIFPSILY